MIKKKFAPLVRFARGARYRSRRQVLRARGCTVGSGVQVHGVIKINVAKGSDIHLGDGVVMNANPLKNTLEARGPVILKTIRPNAEIVVGSHTGMTSTTISSGTSVRIGSRVLLGAGVLITDSDHHPVRLDASMTRRFAGLPARETDRPVVIDDDAFIGARSIVLKGVHIGKNAVVGAGSVVTADIPANCIAAGNPCRVISTVVD